MGGLSLLTLGGSWDRLLPPVPGSTETGSVNSLPVSRMEAPPSRRDTKNWAELVGSRLICSGEQRGIRHSGLKGFVSHLSENRHGREGTGWGVACVVQDKTLQHQDTG